jgi:hypothetical protein
VHRSAAAAPHLFFRRRMHASAHLSIAGPAGSSAREVTAQVWCLGEGRLLRRERGDDGGRFHQRPGAIRADAVEQPQPEVAKMQVLCSAMHIPESRCHASMALRGDFRFGDDAVMGG